MGTHDATEQLAYAIEAAELATWDLDPATGTFTGNQRLKDWFGLDSEGPISLQTALSALAENDRAKVTQAINHALDFSSGGNYEIEYTIINTVTQQERIVRAKGKTLFDNQHVPYRFNGILMDITAEVAGREHRQKLLKLVDNSVDLMSILELDGINSYINAAGKHLLGIEPDADVTIIPISDFHTPEQIAFVEREIIPNVMGKGVWAGQFAIRHMKTGEIIPLYNNCHRIDDVHTGQPIGIGAVMRDMRPEVNARKILEQKVQERTKALEEANQLLEKKNVELASFAYVASHDLQEPLRKIRTFTERIGIMEKQHLTPAGQDYFERINKAATRMQDLIEDLLSYSRTDAGSRLIERTDLNTVVTDVITALHEEIDKQQAVIEIGNLGHAYIIAFQFRQLLDNLISNALKFVKQGEKPHIVIESQVIDSEDLPEGETAHSQQYCRLSITDHGIGFASRYSERIFELFQRLHGREEFSGTGIGLAIVKKIVGNHHGVIKASSQPGQGARFDVYIPH